MLAAFDHQAELTAELKKNRNQKREQQRTCLLASRCRAGSEQFEVVKIGRAVAGKLGRFKEIFFQEFVPESFRWTDCMSRPGTNNLDF